MTSITFFDSLVTPCTFLTAQFLSTYFQYVSSSLSILLFILGAFPLNVFIFVVHVRC